MTEDLGGRSSRVRRKPPSQMTDGRRPDAYLNKRLRGAMSTFSKLSDMETGLAQLSADLESGSWQRKYGALLRETELDIGYRLLVADA